MKKTTDFIHNKKILLKTNYYEGETLLRGGGTLSYLQKEINLKSKQYNYAEKKLGDNHYGNPLEGKLIVMGKYLKGINI